MFSGKTTRLIQLYREYIIQGKKVLVINFSADTRYHQSLLSSHDKEMIPCVFVTDIYDVFRNGSMRNADVILINEGQFFANICETVISMVEDRNKRVHICGLDGDFKREKFGNLLDLIPLCDSVMKLTAKCKSCNSPAIFSHRVSSETEQVVIGVDNFVPLCRRFYVITNL